jgi:hypothetical protein
LDFGIEKRYLRVKNKILISSNNKPRLFALRLNETIWNSRIMTAKRELIEAKAIELLKSTP